MSRGQTISAEKSRERIAEEFQCPACRGHGAIRGPQTNMPWFDCRLCDGTGAVTEHVAKNYPEDRG